MHMAAWATSFREHDDPIGASPAAQDHHSNNNTSSRPQGTSVSSVWSTRKHPKLPARAAAVLLLHLVLAVSLCVLPKKKASPQVPVLRRLSSSEGEGSNSQNEGAFNDICAGLFTEWSPLHGEAGHALSHLPASLPVRAGQDQYTSTANPSNYPYAVPGGAEQRARQEAPSTNMGRVEASGSHLPRSTSSYGDFTHEDQWLTGPQSGSSSRADVGVVLNREISASSPNAGFGDITQWMDALLEKYGDELEQLHGIPTGPVQSTESAQGTSAGLVDLVETTQPSPVLAGHQPSGAAGWSNGLANLGRANLQLSSPGWSSGAPVQFPSSVFRDGSMVLLDLPPHAEESTMELKSPQHINEGPAWFDYGQGSSQQILGYDDATHQAYQFSPEFGDNQWKTCSTAMPAHTKRSVTSIPNAAQQLGKQQFQLKDEASVSSALYSDHINSIVGFITCVSEQGTPVVVPQVMSSAASGEAQASFGANGVIGYGQEQAPNTFALLQWTPAHLSETTLEGPSSGYDEFYCKHLFYRLPKSPALGSLDAFQYDKVACQPGRRWLVSILLPLREFLVKRELTVEDAPHLMRLSGELIYFQLAHERIPKIRLFPGELLTLLGTRFLVVDYLWSVCEVLGAVMNKHLWWDIFTDKLLRIPEMIANRPEQAYDHIVLVHRLIDALRVYRTGNRPPPRVVVELKQELICRGTSPRKFRAPAWKAWREDNKLSTIEGTSH